mmetsp:Transcript_12961/g.37697  ORF Transcript_12961/g.37697 Transcript_12961/m.37697 type:complete len:97 (-) Transcript_12961:280-570(-)
MATVSELEQEFKVKLRKNRFEEVEPDPAGGPMGKFRFLQDNEPTPPKPDPAAHLRRAEEKSIADVKLVEEQEKIHKRHSTKRFTFVIKDTTAPNVN